MGLRNIRTRSCLLVDHAHAERARQRPIGRILFWESRRASPGPVFRSLALRHRCRRCVAGRRSSQRQKQQIDLRPARLASSPLTRYTFLTSLRTCSGKALRHIHAGMGEGEMHGKLHIRARDSRRNERGVVYRSRFQGRSRVRARNAPPASSTATPRAPARCRPRQPCALGAG